METDANEPAPLPLLRWPWVTVATTLACIIIFLGLAVTDDYESPENLQRWGYVDSHPIWKGAYWGLITSCFVHFGIIHLAFNVYWLWVLGGRFELEFGSINYLLFFAFSGFISSSFELTFSGSTGIGASGVGFALFGFAVLVRSKFTSFAEVLDNRMVALWVTCLLGCIAFTYLNAFPIGNVAHVSGMIFGVLVAGYFVMNKKTAMPGIVILFIMSWVSLFWSPWSVHWLSFKAHDLHLNGEYDSALKYYSRIIDRDPHDAWAIWNRGCVYDDLEQYERSSADLKRAKSLDPSIAEFSER